MLRHRWADGTTHLRFDPLELLERLAALTPRPRVNLILYYGVLPPRAAWRAALVPATSPGVETSQLEPSVEADEDASRAKPSWAGVYQWAEPMRRQLGLDVLACPRCGGRLRLVALIEQALVVQRILRHLGLPTEVPEPLEDGSRGAVPNSMLPGEAWRPARRGVGALRRSCSPTGIPRCYSRLLEDNRPQTGALSALS